MDPNNQGSEEYGHDADGNTPRQRPPRDALTSDFGQHTPALARTAQLVSGDYLLTVNPVDGSEIEVCPPAERPGRPVKLTAAERAEITRAARPPVPPGPARPELPLVERDGERERLVRLLARGRSVRLTGPAGSGRTTLLDAVAADCADLAPDGVVRLTGFHRTQTDLLYDLFYAVHSAPLYRPEPDELRALVREVGAVVVLDDVEFGGAALDELLDATPECAFLISATPDVPAPSADSLLEELFLDGLDRAGGLELLERAVGRVLTEDEANWAGDLWFESEGLPLRFVQAGALLRQRDKLRARADAFDDFGVFEDIPADAPLDAPIEAGIEDDVPLPSLAEGAAPAPLLASRLSASARDTLRFAVALGGEVPHQAHLPALVGDTHADAALGELLGCALVSPVGSHYRLAAGVQTQLEAAGYGDGAFDRASTAAQHYAWWAGHPSVTPERVCAEADALLAALAVLVPETTAPAEDEESTAVRLARTAAPAFASGLYWSAWEQVLLYGAEAAQLSGEVSEQAYFHHELGILALCGEQLDLARTELEAALGLRGAVADKRGTVAGRRALTLVADRAGDTPGLGSGPVSTAGEEVPDARYEESASPAGGVPAVFGAAGYSPLQASSAGSASASGSGAGDFAPTVITSRTGGGGAHKVSGIQRLVGGARRNLVAVGAGALLAAVLGTVVTLGATSNPGDVPSDQVGVNPSASPGNDDDSLGADKADNGGGTGGSDSNGDTGTATSRPTDPGPDGTMGTSDDPTPPPAAGGEKPSDEPTGTRTPGGGSSTGTGGSSGSTSPKPTPTPSGGSPSETAGGSPTPTPSGGSATPTPTPTPTPTGPTDEPPPTPTTPDTTVTASGPASSPAQTETASEPASEPASAPVDTDAPTPVI
ncbi:ATP-binding protein [Streptomyces sp. ME02-8801-2C]|uniref:ATP-binding protein n=1 Tax=Streptomyces sp. ME02-8801-2C TaxID=3028680 RepID=UPI0029BED7E8|nr:ATP-binding protein [Streptomyces sp. ME02-8801-2C]MDX3457177.1 ATP-binding protein [Streptomyces sp. ME02-8801-2C]